MKIVRTRKHSAALWLLAVPLATAAPLPVMAATASAGRIVGTIKNALGQPLAGAQLQAQSPDGRIVGNASSESDGSFTFPGIPPGTYSVTANKAGFRTGVAIVTVSPAGGHTTIVLASVQALSLTVAAQRLDQARNALSPETGTSTYRISHEDIQSLPQGDNTPLNQVVLQAPGVAQDSFGQVHVRGDHGDLQYRINGVLLPEGISGFGQTLDTRFANQVTLLTGALPAQYGDRTAGVVDIRTKSGAFAQGGSIDIYGGSRNTLQTSVEAGGSQGALNYYVTGSYLQNNLGIESPTPGADPLHDQTRQTKGFAYLSYLLNPTARLSVILGDAASHFQIPDTAGLTPSFQLAGVTNYPSANLNENQTERNRYGIVALQGSSDKLDYQLAGFSRYSSVLFEPDTIGDLLYNGVASRVYRSGFSNGLQGDGTYRLNGTHTVRAGFAVTADRGVSDNTSTVFPADNSGTQTGTQPFPIEDNQSKTGWQSGVYVQDEWAVNSKLTVNYGARADFLNAYVNASQLSPRVNAVYKLTNKTTLHGGYARYFTPPALELVAPTDLALFQNTTNAPASNQSSDVIPERSDYFDVGVTHQVTAAWQTGLDTYYKDIRHMLDEGQFGQALVFTPFNYSRGKIYGAELSNTYKKDDFSAYLNLAVSRSLAKGVESGQFNFSPAELAYIDNNWVHTDHDQLVTASGGVAYRWRGATWSADAMYGSGLRSGFANTQHLPGYVQVNLGVRRAFDLPQLGKVTGRLSVINAFDRTYEIRDGSGIGVFAPQYGPRRALYAGLSKSF